MPKHHGAILVDTILPLIAAGVALILVDVVNAAASAIVIGLTPHKNASVGAPCFNHVLSQLVHDVVVWTGFMGGDRDHAVIVEQLVPDIVQCQKAFGFPVFWIMPDGV